MENFLWVSMSHVCAIHSYSHEFQRQSKLFLSMRAKPRRTWQLHTFASDEGLGELISVIVLEPSFWTNSGSTDSLVSRVRTSIMSLGLLRLASDIAIPTRTAASLELGTFIGSETSYTIER